MVNDGSPVQVFSNDRVGTFTESSEAWGVETASRMRGAAAADYDRDGFFDLLLSAEGNALNLLLRGSGPGGFSPDVGSPFLLRAGVPGARYGVSFLDADHDMDLDLLMVTAGAGAPLTYLREHGCRILTRRNVRRRACIGRRSEGAGDR